MECPDHNRTHTTHRMANHDRLLHAMYVKHCPRTFRLINDGYLIPAQRAQTAPLGRT